MTPYATIQQLLRPKARVLTGLDLLEMLHPHNPSAAGEDWELGPVLVFDLPMFLLRLDDSAVDVCLRVAAQMALDVFDAEVHEVRQAAMLRAFQQWSQVIRRWAVGGGAPDPHTVMHSYNRMHGASTVNSFAALIRLDGFAQLAVRALAAAQNLRRRPQGPVSRRCVRDIEDCMRLFVAVFEDAEDLAGVHLQRWWDLCRCRLAFSYPLLRESDELM